LTHHVRPTDLIACYGNAKFAVVLPEADVSGACVVGERVRHAVSEAVIMMSDESILPSVTVSVGAAEHKASWDAPALMKAAEAALESAKTIGGDRVGMQLAGG
jgi:diguanylate cyclase (GGDEF)-like protein